MTLDVVNGTENTDPSDGNLNLRQKEKAHDIRLTYVNHESAPTSWRAGD